MKTTLTYLVSAAAMLVSLHTNASPTVLVPDATFDLFAGEQEFTTPGTFTGTSCGGPVGGCETGTASATTSLVLQTSGTGSSAYNTLADATVAIYYEVIGPANLSVPVTIAGYGSVNLSASQGYAYSLIDGGIDAPAAVCIELAEAECDGLGGLLAPSAGALTQSLAATSNTLYDFVMRTGCAGNGTCSTYLDPTVSIDPTFLAANPGYSVELSPNITPATPPASAAPEIDTASAASALTLLLGGLLVLRDRRSTTLNSAAA